jgi:hypothetical protein
MEPEACGVTSVAWSHDVPPSVLYENQTYLFVMPG